MGNYYDGAKLLSLKDINGNTPEIYICTTNRTGGKTSFFGRLVVNRFLERGEKFALLYRFNYELDGIADTFFKDISGLFFPEYGMRAEKRGKGIYCELYLYRKDKDEIESSVSCGYALALNNADSLKKKSHLFSDVKRIIFDEFQSETNKYCPNEITKLISIHTSIARGQGEQTRYVPVYMLSNPVTLINPYYVEFGIAERIRDNTKFLRGEGWVLEQGFVESASIAQSHSAFNRAFSSNKYTAYSSQGVYLNDSKSFIEKPTSKGRYLCTLKYNNKEYGVREYPEEGILYCDNRPDGSYKQKIAITTNDHEINYVMLRTNDFFLSNLRYYFDHGCFRFKDLQCKEVIMKALSY